MSKSLISVRLDASPPLHATEDRRNEKGRKIEREKQIINFKNIEREIVKIIIMK